MIPRTFHHVWLGPDPFPSDFERFRKTWAEHHPHWELQLWNEANLPGDLVRTEVYETWRIPSERSSILRFELLYRFGGVYLDADFECVRPIDELVGDLDFFACNLTDVEVGSKVRVGSGIIGAVPGHPILEQAVREVRGAGTGKRDKAASGTVFFTRILADHPGAHIFERSLFYPLTGAEIGAAYGVHHWARSWKTPEELRESLFKADRKLAEAKEEIRQLQAQLAALQARTPSRLRRLRRLTRRVAGDATVERPEPLSP